MNRGAWFKISRKAYMLEGSIWAQAWICLKQRFYFCTAARKYLGEKKHRSRGRNKFKVLEKKIAGRESYVIMSKAWRGPGWSPRNQARTDPLVEAWGAGSQLSIIQSLMWQQSYWVFKKEYTRECGKWIDSMGISLGASKRQLQESTRGTGAWILSKLEWEMEQNKNSVGLR